METPKKTYGKQGGRPKVGIGRIRKYVVSTRLSPERKLRFSALCREAGQPPAEVLRQLIDRGTVRARISAKRDLIETVCKKLGSSENVPEDVYQGIAYLGYDLEPEAYTQIQQKIMC